LFLNLYTPGYRLSDSLFVGCNSDRYGGAIRTFVDLEITYCHFDRCKVGTSVDSQGGAIRVEEKAGLTVVSSTFTGCTSQFYGGGAISFNGTTLKLENTVFMFCELYNTSQANEYAGGAIQINNSVVNCLNCSWLNCRSLSHGGAIGQTLNGSNLSGNLMKLEDCVFVSNTAAYRGGAIVFIGVALECTRCMLLHNRAGIFGGGVMGIAYHNVLFDTTVFVKNGVDFCRFDELLGGGGGGGGGGGSYVNTRVAAVIHSFSGCVFEKNTVLGECTGFFFF
jgi:hypothetical protein